MNFDFKVFLMIIASIIKWSNFTKCVIDIEEISDRFC